MHTETTQKPTATSANKAGFFTRILNKLDKAMKAKADEAAQNPCCSDGTENKDGKDGTCC